MRTVCEKVSKRLLDGLKHYVVHKPRDDFPDFVSNFLFVYLALFLGDAKAVEDGKHVLSDLFVARTKCHMVKLDPYERNVIDVVLGESTNLHSHHKQLSNIT